MSNSLELLNDPLHPSNSRSFLLSNSVLSWEPSNYVAKIALRADVKEDAILGLAEQVLLSIGGLLQKTARNLGATSSSGAAAADPPSIVAINSGDGPWGQIRMYIGVNENYIRVAVIVITTAASRAFGSLLMSTQTAFCDFASRVSLLLLQALAGEHWTLEQLNDPCQDQADSVLDLLFVVDLISVMVQNMNNRIIRDVDSIDRLVSSSEARCARLMTLLKPSYVRADLALPPLPAQRPLSQYPLALSRPSLRDSQTTDQARLLLLRARKAHRQALLSNEPDTDISQAFQVASVAQHIVEALSDWAREEQQQRLQRKATQARDRLAALVHFRRQLAVTLHSRFQTPAPIPSQTTSFLPSWLGGGGGVGAADRRAHAEVVDRFPFLGTSEAVLLELPCTAPLASWKGTLYVTLGHVLFYGTSGMVRAAVVKVLPFRSLDKVLLLSTQVSETQPAAGAMDAPAVEGLDVDPTAGASPALHSTWEGVCLVDVAGEETLFTATDITPQLHLRMYDLLNLILQEKLFKLVDAKAAVGTVATAASDAGEARASPPAVSHPANSLPPSSPSADASPLCGEDMTDLLRELESLEGVEGAMEVVSFRPVPAAASPPPPPPPPPASLPVSAGSAAGTPPPAVPAAPVRPTAGMEEDSNKSKKKTLGANIQKFLQQKQGQPASRPKTVA